jgi:hypothetical protein
VPRNAGLKYRTATATRSGVPLDRFRRSGDAHETGVGGLIQPRPAAVCLVADLFETAGGSRPEVATSPRHTNVRGLPSRWTRPSEHVARVFQLASEAADAFERDGDCIRPVETIAVGRAALTPSLQ